VTLIPGIGAAIGPIVAVLLAAALLSFLLTPRIRRIVLRYRIVDRPNARRVNRRPIPRSGGLAVTASFLAVAGGFLIVNEQAHLVSVPPSLHPLDVAALLVGGAVAAALGAIDDLFNLRARWQFLGQIALAAGAVALGVRIDIVNDPFGPGIITLEPTIVAIGFTMFWIVGMINSINWIDGLDGLSSGVAIIASVTLGLISLSTRVNQPLIAVLCFVLAGALLGFLRWNFHPAKIFTGTSGVQFVGYTLAILSILGTAKVAVALLVLGVPIIDTFWIIVRRAGSAAHRSLTASTSTIGCSISACRTARRSCSSTACAPRWRCSPEPDRCIAAVHVPGRVHRLRAGAVRTDTRRFRRPDEAGK
jgi:UDP-GlcNAc:undecaprenyl-phosphate GlcNAc-1-phosphate transferase